MSSATRGNAWEKYRTPNKVAAPDTTTSRIQNADRFVGTLEPFEKVAGALDSMRAEGRRGKAEHRPGAGVCSPRVRL
jgi:hypothetical protein